MHRYPTERGNHNDGACSGNAKSGLPSENAAKKKSRSDFRFKRNTRFSNIDNWHLTSAAATFLVAVGVALAVPAQAQSTPGPMQAPIGHRQPRAQDLPPDVLRNEGMALPPTAHQPEAPTLPPDGSHNTGSAPAGRSKLDKNLQICRGC